MADGQELMTTEEYASAQRMLKVLDEQIASLKKKVDRCNEDWSRNPTDKQAFFYSSDSQGMLKFHSDSSFVAEQIFVYGSPLGGRTFLSIEDVASGRKLTTAQEPSFVDNTDTTTKFNGIWIPPSAWCPTLPFTNNDGYDDLVAWNFDHVAVMETEFVVARGGALRFRFRHDQDGWLRPNTTVVPPLNYTVTLVGYKVY